MIALQVQDVKEFMSRLLIGNRNSMPSGCVKPVTTFVTYNIDGSLHKEFFDSNRRKCSLRQSAPSHRGRDQTLLLLHHERKHTPLHFKIIFQLSRQNVEKAACGKRTFLETADVFGLYLNLQYDGSHVTCTTGTSLKTFTMDKSLDRVWDEMVTKFFRQQQIPVLLGSIIY